MPDRGQFRYSFARFADITDTLLTRIGVNRYALYVMDYGRARGLSPGAQASRASHCARHPERQCVRGGAQGVLEADQGVLGERSVRRSAKCTACGHDARRRRVRNISTASPIARGSIRAPGFTIRRCWTVPGNVEIHLDLFYDYRTNLGLYPQFQKFFRERQPPTLIVWGKNDAIFPADGARAYLKDLPRAELHLLDTGHFALEDQGEEIARLMRGFSRPHFCSRPAVAASRTLVSCATFACATSVISQSILAIVNDAAVAYRGVIPVDRWHDPYMSEAELCSEIAAGVEFWGLETAQRIDRRHGRGSRCAMSTSSAMLTSGPTLSGSASARH